MESFSTIVKQTTTKITVHFCNCTFAISSFQHMFELFSEHHKFTPESRTKYMKRNLQELQANRNLLTRKYLQNKYLRKIFI